MKKQMTIKEYYPIARVGDEILPHKISEVEEAEERIIKITDDKIYTSNYDWFWNSNQEIILISQAKPDWDNLRVGDILIDILDNEGIILAVLGDVIWYRAKGKKQTYEIYCSAKQDLMGIGKVKDTREDKEEEIKYSYCEAELNGKEVLRIDGDGNVFLDGKKVGHSDNLEKITTEAKKQALKELNNLEEE